jgi:hypothetical protein
VSLSGSRRTEGLPRRFGELSDVAGKCSCCSPWRDTRKNWTFWSSSQIQFNPCSRGTLDIVLDFANKVGEDGKGNTRQGIEKRQEKKINLSLFLFQKKKGGVIVLTIEPCEKPFSQGQALEEPPSDESDVGFRSGIGGLDLDEIALWGRSGKAAPQSDALSQSRAA